jgi:hypothetical protein
MAARIFAYFFRIKNTCGVVKKDEEYVVYYYCTNFVFLFAVPLLPVCHVVRKKMKRPLLMPPFFRNHIDHRWLNTELDSGHCGMAEEMSDGYENV